MDRPTLLLVAVQAIVCLLVAMTLVVAMALPVVEALESRTLALA